MVKQCNVCKRNVVWVDYEGEAKTCCYCHAASIDAISIDPVAAAKKLRELREALSKAMKWWDFHREKNPSVLTQEEFLERMSVKEVIEK